MYLLKTIKKIYYIDKYLSFHEKFRTKTDGLLPQLKGIWVSRALKLSRGKPSKRNSISHLINLTLTVLTCVR